MREMAVGTANMACRHPCPTPAPRRPRLFSSSSPLRQTRGPITSPAPATTCPPAYLASLHSQKRLPKLVAARVCVGRHGNGARWLGGAQPGGEPAPQVLAGMLHAAGTDASLPARVRSLGFRRLAVFSPPAVPKRPRPAAGEPPSRCDGAMPKPLKPAVLLPCLSWLRRPDWIPPSSSRWRVLTAAVPQVRWLPVSGPALTPWLGPGLVSNQAKDKYFAYNTYDAWYWKGRGEARQSKR